MKFNILPRKPKRTEIADLSGHLALEFLVVPDLVLITREVKYWREELDKAERDDDDFLKAMSSAMKAELRDVSRRGADVQQLAYGTAAAYNPYELGRWYLKARTLIGWSHMWREAMVDIPPTNDWLPYPSGAIDLDFRDIRHLGLHLKDESFRQLMGVEPPDRGKTMWLEGEAVYLQARNPAQASESVLENYEVASGGEPFQPTEFTSIFPHLKASVWPIEP